MAEKDINPAALLGGDLEQCRLADEAYDDFTKWVYCIFTCAPWHLYTIYAICLRYFQF